MLVLNEKQIKFGFNYYHKDESYPKAIVELSQYNGESSATINCTQLGNSFIPKFDTTKKKKSILLEWCDFLSSNTTAFTELRFGTRMPQELFNAVCCQKNLKELHIKWGSYPDISMLKNLSSLEYLHIGPGASVQSIEPIATLKKLIALSVENFQKITDYSQLIQLKKLESLSIDGDGMSPKYIHVDSLDFLTSMQQLRFFKLLTTRVRSKDISPILSLINVEHLTLGSNIKEVKAIYNSIIKLPRLKYGLIVEKPEIYTI